MNDNYIDIFRMNMKFYREKKHWSQSQLAIEINCTSGSIGMIESGKSKPSFDMIIKIANALDINPADLFLRDSSKSKNDIKNNLQELLTIDFPKLISTKFSLDIR